MACDTILSPCLSLLKDFDYLDIVLKSGKWHETHFFPGLSHPLDREPSGTNLRDLDQLSPLRPLLRAQHDGTSHSSGKVR